MKKFFIVFLITFCFGVTAATIFHGIAKKVGPYYSVTVREKYGPTFVIDSVNIIAETDGKFIITRKGDLYGIYPCENYGVEIKK